MATFLVAFFLKIERKMRNLLLGVCFAIIWSSAFTSARISMFDAPPFLFLSLRFFIAGLIAIIIAFIIGQSMIFSKPEWLAIVIFGVCQNTVYLGLNFVAMQWITASLAAIIASLLPLVVTVLLWFFYKEKLNLIGFIGLIFGMFGLMLVIYYDVPSKLNTIGILFCFLGVVSLATATIIIRHSSSENLLMLVGLQMLIGSITLFPLSISLEEWKINWTTRLIYSFLYTTIFPGLIATFIWFKLLRSIGPIKAAAFHFLNPFFGVLIANIILSEKLTWNQLLGVFMVTIAIMALQLSKLKKISTQ